MNSQKLLSKLKIKTPVPILYLLGIIIVLGVIFQNICYKTRYIAYLLI